MLESTTERIFSANAKYWRVVDTTYIAIIVTIFKQIYTYSLSQYLGKPWVSHHRDKRTLCQAFLNNKYAKRS